MSRARQNSTFPLQPKIFATVKRQLRNMAFGGFTKIQIPWKDFVFSNKEPWPKQFRDGLQNLCSFLEHNKPVEPDDTKFYTLGVAAGDKKDKVTLNEPEIFEVIKKSNHHSLQVLVTAAGKKIPIIDLPFIYSQTQIPVTCDGVEIYIEKKKKVNKTDDNGSFRAIAYHSSFRLVLVISVAVNYDDTVMHEVMHFVQYCGAQLLTALTRPNRSFVFVKPNSLIVNYGGQKKEDQGNENIYQEESIEFYPWAQNIAKQVVDYIKTNRLTQPSKNTLSNLIIPVWLNVGLEISTYRQRYALLAPAYQYACRLLQVPYDFSDLLVYAARFDPEVIVPALAGSPFDGNKLDVWATLDDYRVTSTNLLLRSGSDLNLTTVFDYWSRLYSLINSYLDNKLDAQLVREYVTNLAQNFVKLKYDVNSCKSKIDLLVQEDLVPEDLRNALVIQSVLDLNPTFHLRHYMLIQLNRLIHPEEESQITRISVSEVKSELKKLENKKRLLRFVKSKLAS